MKHHEQPGRAYARPYTYSVAEILAPLSLGTSTFPHVVPAPERFTVVPPDEDIEPVGAWIGWPGEGWWCE